MLSRRTFIAGAAFGAAWPAAVFGQDKPAAGRVYRVGVLDSLSAAENAANLLQFQKGMRELGYAEGGNLTTIYRTTEGRSERFAAQVARLASAGVDAFVARGTPATLAAMELAGNTPVVAAGIADPVETRIVVSMQKPGGKVTGIGFLLQEVESRRIGLLRAVAPNRTRIAAMLDMGNPAMAATWKITQAAAGVFGMQAQLIDVRKPQEMGAAFDAARAGQAQALVVRLPPLSAEQRRSFVELAARHRLPAIYGSRQFVEAGGLVSYGVSVPHMYFRAAYFVDRLFKGAPAAELPMEKPPKFEFIVNRKALHALGLTLPPDLLLKSDEIV